MVYARPKKNRPVSNIVDRYQKSATSIFKQFCLKRPSLHRNGIRTWPGYIKRNWPRGTETRQPWRLPESWSPACWWWIKTSVHFRAWQKPWLPERGNKLQRCRVRIFPPFLAVWGLSGCPRNSGRIPGSRSTVDPPANGAAQNISDLSVFDYRQSLQTGVDTDPQI